MFLRFPMEKDAIEPIAVNAMEAGEIPGRVAVSPSPQGRGQSETSPKNSRIEPLNRIVFTLTLRHGNPPLPGPPPLFGGLKERGREKKFLAFVPRVARSEPDWPTSQPWANCLNPFGVLRFKGSLNSPTAQ